MPSLPEFLILSVLTIGASTRLQRLIGADTITEPLRAWVIRKSGSDRAGEFLACPWCSGFWTSVLCVLVAWLSAGLPWGVGGTAAFVGACFTVSYAVGFLAGHETDEH
ncbi:hypothetical protein ACIRL3_25935 [Streptomyces sp. NPDC102384]|uniref:hypothetical protein n=1 Tax=Streptomyces sp. NPDC102384 TaxID=3366166 RepID=UPI003824705D